VVLAVIPSENGVDGEARFQSIRAGNTPVERA
jgi:hypothetical protein